MITSAEDLVHLMQWDKPVKNQPVQPQIPIFNQYTSQEQSIVDELNASGATHVNILAAKLGKRVHELTALLIDMEFKGYIHALPGGKYTI